MGLYKLPYNKGNKMKRQLTVIIKVIIVTDYDPLNIIGNHESIAINK